MANKNNLFMVEQLLPFFNHPCVRYEVDKVLSIPYITVTIELRITEPVYYMMNADNAIIPKHTRCITRKIKGKTVYYLQGWVGIRYEDLITLHNKTNHLMKSMMCHIRSHKIIELQNQINYISGMQLCEITME